jgi:hypothetical protein
MPVKSQSPEPSTDEDMPQLIREADPQPRFVLVQVNANHLLNLGNILGMLTFLVMIEGQGEAIEGRFDGWPSHRHSSTRWMSRVTN